MDRFAGNFRLHLEIELLQTLSSWPGDASLILRSDIGEDDEHRQGEADAGNRGDLLREQVGKRHKQQGQSRDRQTDRILAPADRDVQWRLVFLVVPLEPENQHAQSLKEETPDHAERIGFAKQNDVAAAPEDRADLQESDHVDQPVARTEFAVRLSEPRSQNVVFSHAVQDAVGADHRGVDGAGKNQHTDDDDKNVKRQPQQLRAREVHGEAAEQVIRYSDRVRRPE